MTTNIAYKTAACMQISFYEGVQALAQKHPYVATPIAALVSAVDVTIETVKYPIAAIESVALAAINAVGSSFSKKCSLLDAHQNIKIAGIMSGATVVMMALSPLNFLACLLVNLPDPKNAHSCNREADEQANFPAIAFDSNERRALQEAIKNKNLSAVEELLTNDKLTNQSVGRAIENAAENGYTDAVTMLLTDSRLTKQSIGRALEKATQNNHPEIIPLIGGLIQPVLAKYNQNETPSSSAMKELQKDNLFISTCLSKAKKIAMSHNYLEVVSHLDDKTTMKIDI